MLIVLLAFAMIFAIFFMQSARYKKTEYYRQTRIGYVSLWFDKGKSGEYKIYRSLNELSGYKQYLFNLYIPKENGGTTEIDVVLLHDSGIYVFESKNFSGWIFGTETQKYWTQTLPMGRKQSLKNRFYNPIMQNKGHVKWLKSYLQKANLPIFSCIVFGENCSLKDINLTSGEHAVVDGYEVLFTVSEIAAANGVRLSKEQIDDMYDKLYPLTQVDEAAKLLHIQEICGNISKDSDNTYTRIVPDASCPRCGGNLVPRMASKGKYKGVPFLGCENFPQCRFIKMADSVSSEKGEI